MKKLALALMSTAAAVLGFGLAVDAYPPGAGVVTATPASGAPGYSVTVKASCLPGETVTATLESESGMGTCGAAGTASVLGLSTAGGATVVVATPTTAGTYTGNVTGSTTGFLGNFGVTVTAPPVPPTGLPATGSSGISTMTILAIGLFAAGAGLFAVSQVRRRQSPIL